MSSAATDKALLELLKVGDSEAFSRVVRVYSASMVRLAAKILPSPAAAEDVVQDAWLAVLRALPRFDGRSSLKTWIFQIVVNQAKYHRDRQLRLWRIECAEDGTGLSSPRISAGTAAGRRSLPVISDEVTDRILLDEVMTYVRASVAALPSRQARVIVLRDVTGLSSSDVCDELGLTAANQRALLHRARTHIRHDLERLGY